MIIREYYNFINESKNVCFSNEKCPFLWTDGAKDGDFLQAIYDIENCWYKNGFSDDYDRLLKMEKDFGVEYAILTLFGYYNSQVCNGGHVQYWDNGYASFQSSGFGGNHKDIGNVEYMIDHFKDAGLYTSDLNKKIYGILEEAKDIFEYFTDGETQCEHCNGNGEEEDNCYNCEGGKILDTCNNCSGEGEYEGDDGEMEDCSECGGNGEVEENCPDCDGDGIIYNNCEYCDGSGNIDPRQDYENELNFLDNKYYEIYEEWMDYLKSFAKDLIVNRISKEEWGNFKVRINAEKYNI